MNQVSARISLARNVTVLKNIMDADGIVLGGTDMPLADIAVSLHLNLRALTEYGLTPYEALRTVTILPAEKMGVSDDLGTIEEGKLADFVFVKGNPLDDIEDAANVQQVMKNGKTYTVDEIMEPYNQNDEEISTAEIMTLVEKYNEEGEINDDDAVESLLTHLTAVSHYEEKEQAEKVVKHMNGFKQLLKNQKENDLMSEEASKTLREKSDSLITKWE